MWNGLFKSTFYIVYPHFKEKLYEQNLLLYSFNTHSNVKPVICINIIHVLVLDF